MLKFFLLWTLGSIGLGLLFAGAIVAYDWWERRRMERRIRHARRDLERRRARAIRAWREERRTRPDAVASGKRRA